ncbi:MAG: HRDC domain-containing protein [Roseimicrobium sp.]
MPFAFFKMPVCPPPEAVEELNRFLRQHRVLGVQREFVSAGECSYWALCVDYMLASTGSKASADQAVAAGRKDYKEEFPPEKFQVFLRLRQLRKELAERDGLPVFAVFSNEQLAEMLRRDCKTKAQLKEIVGIGDARLEKYAGSVLALLAPGAPA